MIKLYSLVLFVSLAATVNLSAFSSKDEKKGCPVRGAENKYKPDQPVPKGTYTADVDWCHYFPEQQKFVIFGVSKLFTEFKYYWITITPGGNKKMWDRLVYEWEDYEEMEEASGLTFKFVAVSVNDESEAIAIGFFPGFDDKTKSSF